MENTSNSHENPKLNAQIAAAAYISGSPDYPDIRGTVMFYSTDGGVIVSCRFTGLPKLPKICRDGIFGLHIHSGTSCSGNKTDSFSNAGTHYNPDNLPHPCHAGDLPPIFGCDGSAFSAFLTNRFTIEEIIRKTVILHDSPDDFTSQPSGNSGSKIACGIIRRVPR